MFGASPDYSSPGDVFLRDPRSYFIRRAHPFLTPPLASMSGGSGDYFPPRHFSDPPHPPVPMRNVYSPRGFPSYLPPRAGCPPTISMFLEQK
jgi:hypothetical protein